jgi:hypothetical protein
MELQPRSIANHELILVKYLLDNAYDKTMKFEIPAMVYTMADGGMGSIHFITQVEQKYRSDIVSVTYIDIDKTPVFIDLMLGDQGQLFELDFWKADFSKLIDYPKPEQVSIDPSR